MARCLLARLLVAACAVPPLHGSGIKCSTKFTVNHLKAPDTASQYNGVELPDVCIQHPGPYHAFVIGDWGGIVYFDFLAPRPADKRSVLFPLFRRRFVKGIDDSAQMRVSRAMQAAANLVKVDYILNVGDNFYWGGIKGVCGDPPFTADPSKQWNNTFEWVYDGSLAAIPWLGVLGNHDYGGYKFTSKWEENIGYSWGGGATNTRRWVTPALYWGQRVHYPGFAVDYLFVDTNPTEAWLPGLNDDHNICSKAHNEVDDSCGAQGPTSLAACHNWFWGMWDTQWVWLHKRLGQSLHSRWQIAVTHFPPKWFKSQWNCLADKYGIDLHISGHVHHQRILAPGDKMNDIHGPTCTIVSGGGGGITSEGIPSMGGHDDQYGFVDLMLTKDHITVHAISHGAKLRKKLVCHGRGHNPGRQCKIAERNRKRAVRYGFYAKKKVGQQGRQFLRRLDGMSPQNVTFV